jgi:hypothetical protein
MITKVAIAQALLKQLGSRDKPVIGIIHGTFQKRITHPIHDKPFSNVPSANNLPPTTPSYTPAAQFPLTPAAMQ